MCLSLTKSSGGGGLVVEAANADGGGRQWRQRVVSVLECVFIKMLMNMCAHMKMFFSMCIHEGQTHMNIHEVFFYFLFFN